MDANESPIGAMVVALNGEALGRVEEVHPHFLLVEAEGEHGGLSVPVHAVARREDGRLHLSVNREALTPVDDEEAAGRRLDGV